MRTDQVTAKFTHCRHNQPLVQLESEPFNGCELRPAALRTLARLLTEIADYSEQSLSQKLDATRTFQAAPADQEGEAKEPGTATPAPALPPFRAYENLPNSGLFCLPFMHKRGDGVTDFWHVPAGNNHGQACAMGRQYAAHFTQWVKANGERTGFYVLGHIAHDINFKDKSQAGYWTGFFSQIERLVLLGSMVCDVWREAHREGKKDLQGGDHD
jgi:hypothetical protein